MSEKNVNDQSVDENNESRPSTAGRKPIIWVAGALGLLALVALVVMSAMFLVGPKGMHDIGMDSDGMVRNGFDSRGQDGRGMRGMHAGQSGEVTKISSTSISVKDARSGGETTYAVSDKTTVRKDDADASLSDVKVGDTVRVQPTIATDDTLLSAVVIVSDEL